MTTVGKPSPTLNAENLLNKFREDISNLCGKYAALQAKLFVSQENISKMKKDWQELNGEFFKRIQKAKDLSTHNIQIVNSILNSRQIGPNKKQQLIEVATQMNNTFLEQISKLEMQALFQLFNASKELGMEEFPVHLKEFNEAEGKPAPTLFSRLLSKVSGMFFNKTAATIAGVSAVILAGQAGVPIETMVSGATNLATRFISNVVIPVAYQAASTTASFALNKPSTWSALSVVCAAPNAINAWRSGNKDKALVIASLGTASAVVPHLFATAVQYRY